MGPSVPAKWTMTASHTSALCVDCGAPAAGIDMRHDLPGSPSLLPSRGRDLSERENGMTKESTQQPPRRNKLPLFLALGALVVVIVAVVVVLALAGGNKTTDGTVRVRESNVTSSTNVTNSNGSGAGGPVR